LRLVSESEHAKVAKIVSNFVKIEVEYMHHFRKEQQTGGEALSRVYSGLSAAFLASDNRICQ